MLSQLAKSVQQYCTHNQTMAFFMEFVVLFLLVGAVADNEQRRSVDKGARSGSEMQQNQKGHTGLDGPEGPRKHGCEASLAGNPGSARLGGQPKAARPEGSVGYGDTRSISEPAGPRETTGTTRSGNPKELGEREEAADRPAGLAGPEESAGPGEPTGDREEVAPARSDKPAGPEGPVVSGELAAGREQATLATFFESAGPAGPGEPSVDRGDVVPIGAGPEGPAGPGEPAVDRGEPEPAGSDGHA